MRQSAGYSLARAKAAGGRNSQFQKASPGGGTPFQSANAFRSHDKTPNTSAYLRIGRRRGGAHATVGRAQSGNPKAGACQKFHKHVAAEASADGSRKMPREDLGESAPFCGCPKSQRRTIFEFRKHKRSSSLSKGFFLFATV